VKKPAVYATPKERLTVEDVLKSFLECFEDDPGYEEDIDHLESFINSRIRRMWALETPLR